MNCVRCGSTFVDVRALVKHLAEYHMVSGTEAQREANDIASGAAVAPNMERPPITAEAAMPAITEPIKCIKCKEPFVRKHPRQTICAKCSHASAPPHAPKTGDKPKVRARKVHGRAASRPEAAPSLSKSVADLVADIAKGKRAEAELKEVERLLKTAR